MPGQNENYNPSFDTPLGQVDEVLYRLYKNMYAPTDKSGTYDYRGAYLAGVAPNTGSNPAQFGHFTDQFKKPNYPTFSVESQYAGAYPEKAGRWQGDTFIPAGYKKGTSNVKTKKYAKGTDSVPSMLSPREAVLNRNAAEILGRHNIAALNAHGNMLAKRGVDLASLPSDPTPGPSTENLLGYQMGTPDVMHDDTADLLREADSAFYGGGGAPPPTPTPTPIPQKYKRGTSMVRMMGYQYGTSSVDDLRNKNAAGRINRPGIINIQADPTKPGYNPISASQYIGRGGALLGSQYNQTTGRVNPLPIGAVGVQGFSQPTQSFSPKPMTHTQMATDIARRNLTATSSSLGAPQPEAPIQGDPNRPSNISSSSYQAYLDQSGSTTHFLPPGFSATTGSTGAPNSAQNDIHFLPPGFSSVQGVTNPITKQLQQDQGYGSAYGY